MIAIIDANGELAQIVSSLDGVDTTGCTLVEDVPEPPHDYAWDAQAQAFKPTPLIERYQRMLDEAIDAIRGRYPAPGQYMAEEYRITAEQATAFAQAGFAGDVPLAVDAWARASGMTPQQAAENILHTETLYRQMLLVTREARLIGKAQMSLAQTEAQAKAVYDATLAQLESLLPQPT